METPTKVLLLGAILLVLAAALAVGCGGGGSSSGSMSIGLTDAANLDPNVEHVWVTIDSIDVHRESADEDGEWIQVVPNAHVATPLTVDLLALRNGLTQDLGLSTLPADHYTQIRLHLGEVPEGGLNNPHPYANYVVIGAGGGDEAGDHELTVPSGYQSGLKLTHEFTIQEGTTYEIALDIDTLHIHRTGSGKYMMKPTIRAVEIDLTGRIEGSVSVQDCELTPENVTVMAQVQDDPEDPTSVRVVQSALSDADGNYTLAFLPPGTYTVVAYKDGGEGSQVALGMETVTVAAGQTATVPIDITCHDRLAVDGTVTDTGVPPGQQDSITPIVTVYVDGDPDYVIAVVGAPWDGAAYAFSVGLPSDEGFNFQCVSDLGTAHVAD